MKITIDGHEILLDGEGVRIRNESQALYCIKMLLNRKGIPCIKKRMWKDGHLVSEEQQYVRSDTKFTDKTGNYFYVYNPYWQVCDSTRAFAIDWSSDEYRSEFMHQLNGDDNE